MQVDKYDAEYLGSFDETSDIQPQKEEQYKDAGYLDGSAFRHAIGDIIKEVDEIATHGQHNEGVELPESGLGGWVSV
jgi:hypothetical protein